MKLYRVHYGDDIKEGVYRGNTGAEKVGMENIVLNMKNSGQFYLRLVKRLHNPTEPEFIQEPRHGSFFYFKQSFFSDNKILIEDFINTAKEMGVTVNITTIDLDTITSYECIYQDENQMCLNIN